MMNILKATKLKKTYQMGKVEIPALKGVDLSIKDGEFVSIMGHSGSGKSTLLHLLGMLDTPTSGEIFIEASSTYELDENQKVDFRLKKIGFVFQFFNLLFNLTALENVMLPMMMAKQKNYEERGMELLEMVGLSNRINHKPAELSGGQQQRVAIARALANNPKIVLADEPTGNLDSNAAMEILTLLKELNGNGQTIVMVTHELEWGKIADRIVCLKDGMIEKMN